MRVAAEVQRAGDPLLGAVAQTAALIATTWASVKLPSSEVPRCPDVPNATGADGSCPV